MCWGEAHDRQRWNPISEHVRCNLFSLPLLSNLIIERKMLWYRTLLSVIDITWNLEQHYKLETRRLGIFRYFQ